MGDHERRRRVGLSSLALSVNTMRTLSFLAGLAMTINDAHEGGPESRFRYALWAGMMGLAVVWRAPKDGDA